MIRLPHNTPCCKCGSNDINRTYYDESQHVYKPVNPPKQKSNEFVDRTGVFWVAKKECIVHHCRVCHYEWDTACLTNHHRNAEEAWRNSEQEWDALKNDPNTPADKKLLMEQLEHGIFP